MTPIKPTYKRTTAQESYRLAEARINDAIKQLKNQLKEHKAKAKREPKNWGYAGDLEKVAYDLEALLEFMS